LVTGQVKDFVDQQPDGLDGALAATHELEGAPAGDGTTIEKLQININKDAHGSFDLEVAERICAVNNNYWHFLEPAMCCGLVGTTDSFWTIFEALLLTTIVDGSS